jgi:hypothetical protein
MAFVERPDTLSVWTYASDEVFPIEALSSFTQCSSQTLGRLPSGRPYLPTWTGDISLSYGEGLTALGAIRAPFRLGLDAESVSTRIEGALLQELERLFGDLDPLRAWTLCEAYFKCVDKTFALNQIKIECEATHFRLRSTSVSETSLITIGTCIEVSGHLIAGVLGAPPQLADELNLIIGQTFSRVHQPEDNALFQTTCI